MTQKFVDLLGLVGSITPTFQLSFLLVMSSRLVCGDASVVTMSVFALRGAITVDSDTPEEIRGRTIQLLEEMFERNDLRRSDIISVFFTSTKDLVSLPPAAAARAFGLNDVALLCAQEAEVEGGLEQCVRVMLHLNTTKEAADFRHVFLRRATEVRPDLAEPGDEDF